MCIVLLLLGYRVAEVNSQFDDVMGKGTRPLSEGSTSFRRPPYIFPPFIFVLPHHIILL